MVYAVRYAWEFRLEMNTRLLQRSVRARRQSFPRFHRLEPSNSSFDAIQAAKDSIMSREATQKSRVPQIIKSDMALKLAEQWVNNMTKVAEDEQTEAESEGRPSRLGLGAKFSRQMRPGPSNDPVERKLYANLQSGKRKGAKDAEESGLTARDPGGDSDIDDELESRASAFSKKRVIIPPVSLTMKKKRR